MIMPKLTAAPLVLRRGRCGGRIFGGGQPTRMVGVSSLELRDRLRRPLFKGERAVAVGVELCERLVAWRENLVGLDLSVLVLVRSRKPFLLAARLGRLRWV